MHEPNPRPAPDNPASTLIVSDERIPSYTYELPANLKALGHPVVLQILNCVISGPATIHQNDIGDAVTLLNSEIAGETNITSRDILIASTDCKKPCIIKYLRGNVEAAAGAGADTRGTRDPRDPRNSRGRASSDTSISPSIWAALDELKTSTRRPSHNQEEGDADGGTTQRPAGCVTIVGSILDSCRIEDVDVVTLVYSTAVRLELIRCNTVIVTNCDIAEMNTIGCRHVKSVASKIKRQSSRECFEMQVDIRED